MNDQLWWYLARATGIVAWSLLSAAVIGGLLLKTRLMHGRPTPAWLLDVHRFLGGTAVIFTVVHIVGLVADDYVQFGPTDVMVPLASSWRPLAVAFGVVGLYLLVAVQVTSLLMRRLPRAAWRAVHTTSFVLFWSATFHLLLAGTDARNAVMQVLVDVVIAAVVFLSLVRMLAPNAPRRAAMSRPGSSRWARSARDA